MENSKLETYKVDGSVIDIEWDEAVYDCFVFDSKKIVVLKTEQFDEFIEPISNQPGENNKQFMLGKVCSNDGIDYIFPLLEENYNAALEYYLSLKKAFLGVADE